MNERSPWEHYEARVQARGGNERRAVRLKREARTINLKLPWNLSYHAATIDGEERQLAIINSDNLDQKTLLSMPGEDLPHGGLVEWMDNHWLIIEKDANNELYTRAKMRQCNYLLRWVDDEKQVQERWCIIEDGTKYLTGEYGDRNFVINRGDSRVSLILARDADTVKLNRKNRFLIDDYDSPAPLAYRLTKPFKLGGSYNGKGVLNFVLTECNTEDGDDLERNIPNYFDVFPDEAVCVNYPDCRTRLVTPDEQGWTVADDHLFKPDEEYDPTTPDVYEQDAQNGEHGTTGKKVWL